MRSLVLLSAALLALGGCSEPSPEATSEGEQIAADKGCVSCHSTDGSAGIGPTWKDLYGSQVELVDGSKVLADDAYLRESMLLPSQKTVKGFSEGTMEKAIPPGSLSDAEVAALIRYIRSLQ